MGHLPDIGNLLGHFFCAIRHDCWFRGGRSPEVDEKVCFHQNLSEPFWGVFFDVFCVISVGGPILSVRSSGREHAGSRHRRKTGSFGCLVGHLLFSNGHRLLVFSSDGHFWKFPKGESTVYGIYCGQIYLLYCTMCFLFVDKFWSKDTQRRSGTNFCIYVAGSVGSSSRRSSVDVPQGPCIGLMHGRYLPIFTSLNGHLKIMNFINGSNDSPFQIIPKLDLDSSNWKRWIIGFEKVNHPTFQIHLFEALWISSSSNRKPRVLQWSAPGLSQFLWWSKRVWTAACTLPWTWRMPRGPSRTLADMGVS